MDAFIETIKASSTPVQALAVTVGGLIGVFATLFVFWFMIYLSEHLGKKE
jgi:hypothetical protein